jgi:hypothetical protein
MILQNRRSEFLFYFIFFWAVRFGYKAQKPRDKFVANEEPFRR